MTEPIRAADRPAFISVEKDQTYFWCACGLSKKQPFCDGSHSSTDINPLKYVADKDETLSFCQCKQSKKAPFCDGSHSA